MRGEYGEWEEGGGGERRGDLMRGREEERRGDEIM